MLRVVTLHKNREYPTAVRSEPKAKAQMVAVFGSLKSKMLSVEIELVKTRSG